jgi:hypothetical protein
MGKKPLIITLVVLSILGLVIIFQVGANKHADIPTTLPVSPTDNLTIDKNIDISNWNTYSNDSGYSIKYPQEYTTQNVAAGAGSMEALANSSHIYIYKKGADEPFLKRAIEIQNIGLKPTHSNNLKVSKMTINKIDAEKITREGSPFDTYYISINEEEALEILVANSDVDQEMALSILSTIELR